MSKKKGVSLEEKRDRILGIFHESKSCWLLKDVEKEGAKRGVIFQSVKEVLQGLIDDDMVYVDKIGTSNWYWSFPSAASNKTRVKRAALEEELSSAKKRQKELEKQKSSAASSREDTETRQDNLAALGRFEEEHSALSEELAKYRDNDPEYFEELKNAAIYTLEAGNRWTDNIFQLQKWATQKFDGDSTKVTDGFKSLGCDLEGLDYLE
ncbi:Meiotic nuclear division protein 1 [Cymbomonas tetramitiformis]|uniref:Meiotic nuclear division protein 1 homolog n=1 Tax=Cymbomonas tetramitiformis TaxID=36881 RepID=A0AAE0KXG3_9CHLO|nr:Meiotic nuclear division protein 1 [Cymbomonas tetramitiformis]